MHKYINNKYIDFFYDPSSGHERYCTEHPFPNAVFNNFFNEDMLDQVLKEFPDLEKEDSIKFDEKIQRKFAGKGEVFFGEKTQEFMRFLNSESFLVFIQRLTNINERLIADPYFMGGGQHEIKKGGVLKVHADFKKHKDLGLDRRINALVYLNKDWKEEYGGHFELWNVNLESCDKKILPEFNTLAIFSTTDYSFHGHPNPLTCPDDRSRKSLALYYYTNGRPKEEIDPNKGDTATLFVGRKGNSDDEQAFKHRAFIGSLREYLPPFLFKWVKGMINR